MNTQLSDAVAGMVMGELDQLTKKIDAQIAVVQNLQLQLADSARFAHQVHSESLAAASEQSLIESTKKIEATTDLELTLLHSEASKLIEQQSAILLSVVTNKVNNELSKFDDSANKLNHAAAKCEATLAANDVSIRDLLITLLVGMLAGVIATYLLFVCH